MSTGAAGAGASAAATRASPNPWLIAVLVAFATFMEVLDTTIANVALPYIAGGMGVSEDAGSTRTVGTTDIPGPSTTSLGRSSMTSLTGTRCTILT